MRLVKGMSTSNSRTLDWKQCFYTSVPFLSRAFQRPSVHCCQVLCRRKPTSNWRLKQNTVQNVQVRPRSQISASFLGNSCAHSSKPLIGFLSWWVFSPLKCSIASNLLLNYFKIHSKILCPSGLSPNKVDLKVRISKTII